MQTIKVSALNREQAGKEAAARLRATGRIPAVAYGKGMETRSLSVPPGEVSAILTSAAGRNTLVSLAVGGSDEILALVADYQYHPVTRALLHVDFVRVREDQPIDIEVPFEATGKPAGVVAGGMLRVVYRKLPLRCLPGQIPLKITHDMTAV
ncbi:MAG: 50S ribosomal protein L25, partial [Deltaproteobacteria bacterium]|nr:50S ribosomal protein L25 [Deltaproteobacteria bacterium]